MTAAYHKLAGPQATPLAELFGKVDEEFADISPILKLPMPCKTLASFAAASAEKAGASK